MPNIIAVGTGVGTPFDNPLGYLDPMISLKGFFTNFWKMDGLTDSIGSLTLTNSVNPVTFGPGKIGNDGNFNPRSENRSLTRAAVPFTGPSFTVALWMLLNIGVGNTRTVQFSWNGVAAGSVQITVAVTAAGVISFYTDASAAPGKRCDSAANTYADGLYHLVVAYHDGVSKVNTLIIDNGTPVTQAATADLANTSANLRIGGYSELTGFSHDGHIDAVGFADNKLPTAEQINALWNSGMGGEFPF